MKVRRQVEESKDVEAGVSGLKPWCGRTERYATGWKTQLLKDRRSQRERGRTGTGVEIIRTRLSGTKHVSMMSPVPAQARSASPASRPCARREPPDLRAALARRPPRARCSRAPAPPSIPAAIASTFFSAPESISTPVDVVWTCSPASCVDANSRCTRHGQLLVFVDAATIAVGRPCISSTANVGPDSTASGWSRPSPAWDHLRSSSRTCPSLRGAAFKGVGRRIEFMGGVEGFRDRKRRGVGGETRALGTKVLKKRRSPRERGRTGTSVR